MADKFIPFKFRRQCVDVNSYNSLENVAKSVEPRGCGYFTTGTVGLRKLNNLTVHAGKTPETNRSEAGRKGGLAGCSGSRSSNSCRPLRVQHTATWSGMATATRRQNIATFLLSLFAIHEDICLVHQLPYYTDRHHILPYYMSSSAQSSLINRDNGVLEHMQNIQMYHYVFPIFLLPSKPYANKPF